MTKFAVLSVIVCAMTSAVPTHSADAAMPTEATCRSILSHTGQITVETATPVGADGCTFENVHVTITQNQSWSIEKITLTRLDFASLAAGPQVPPTLRAEAHGIRFSPVTQNKVANYVFRVTIRPFDITLDYDGRTDPTRLQVSEFSMQGRNVGDLRVSGEIDGITPAMIQAPNMIMESTAGLKLLRVHLDNQGFVESYLVAPLAGAVLQDSEDPEATVKQMQQTAVTALRGLLAPTGTPPATIDALATFIGDFPHPAKVLDVTLNLPKAIGMADIMQLQQGAVTLRDLLPAGALAATYAPASQQAGGPQSQ